MQLWRVCHDTLDFVSAPGYPGAIETRSLPTLTHVLPPIRPLGFAHLCRSRPRGSVHSLLPSSFYLLCRLAPPLHSRPRAHALPPYCCSTLALAYDVFFPRKHPSGFPSMSHRLIRLQPESLTLSGLPIHVARIPATPFHPGSILFLVRR
jgi:hypothetical protein